MVKRDIVHIQNLLKFKQVETTFPFPTSVHKDVTERMMQINPTLAAQARKILDINKSERHIRGGMATKEKYHQLHEHMQGEKRKNIC